MQNEKWTVGLAVFLVIAAAATLFIWIPNDIETGVVETFRRRVTIGDAMAPTMVAAALLVVSILMGVTAYFGGRQQKHAAKAGLDKQSFTFLLRLTIAVGLGLGLMVYTGPVIVDIINSFGGEIGTYRHLKAAFPYKYLGYVLGGFFMVFGLIRVVENRFSASAAWASIIAVLVLTILYDVPFENLLLPPNGDH
ncbi:MAG TPA: hypothetical protein QF359_08485 [Rhodospirillales bacterium]|jgi:hypothetical protein|nr:hypothetical protein [Rhodospirillales bacterium]HJO86983.1 hypothetical protein [Rhodospirillales bacterium]|tara:strand:+ start:1299 stop:1880 length:582 start_codon:yes stop_codon:yes gene_type:complete